MKYLIFDISNLLYRTFFVNKDENDKTITGLATHSAFITLNKYYKQIKPHKVVMVFDRKNSWRETFAASDQSITKKEYKGSRKTKREAMGPAEAAKYALFVSHLKEFEQLITEHTSITTLAAQGLEADDLVAGFIRKHPQDEITLISSDSDFVQLLKFPNLTIISPDSGKPQTLEEYNNSAEYFLFVKCIRGDKTDDVMSAYPKVRETRLRKAFFEDPYEMTQIMETKWTDQDKIEHVVKDIYNENRIFIDLDLQPPHIKQLIENVIDTEMEKTKKFSFFHIMKFLGKYDLKKVADSIEQYKELLSR